MKKIIIIIIILISLAFLVDEVRIACAMSKARAEIKKLESPSGLGFLISEAGNKEASFLRGTPERKLAHARLEELCRRDRKIRADKELAIEKIKKEFSVKYHRKLR